MKTGRTGKTGPLFFCFCLAGGGGERNAQGCREYFVLGGRCVDDFAHLYSAAARYLTEGWRSCRGKKALEYRSRVQYLYEYEYLADEAARGAKGEGVLKWWLREGVLRQGKSNSGVE